MPAENAIETYTGRYFDFANPRNSEPCVEDIAHALANTCRYGGHCKEYFSVAEHAVICAVYARKHGWSTVTQLACLHHDDAEAYLGDIPRPLKPLLQPRYGELTEEVDSVIADSLGGLWTVGDVNTNEVHEADNFVLRLEADVLLPSRGNGWTKQTFNVGMADADIDSAHGLRLLCLDPRPAERDFLYRHNKLVEELHAASG